LIARAGEDESYAVLCPFKEAASVGNFAKARSRAAILSPAMEAEARTKVTY
jgi:hypothetical protein